MNDTGGDCPPVPSSIVPARSNVLVRRVAAALGICLLASGCGSGDGAEGGSSGGTTSIVVSATTEPAQDDPSSTGPSETATAAPAAVPGESCGRVTLSMSGNPAELYVDQGTIGCADAMAVFDRWQTDPSLEHVGNTWSSMFDGWTCAAPTATAARIGGFAAECTNRATGVAIRARTSDATTTATTASTAPPAPAPRSDGSYGPVAVGMAESDAVAAGTAGPQMGRCRMVQYPGPDGTATATIKDGTVLNIQTPPGAVTAAGVGDGSTVEQVRAAYGADSVERLTTQAGEALVVGTRTDPAVGFAIEAGDMVGPPMLGGIPGFEYCSG